MSDDDATQTAPRILVCGSRTWGNYLPGMRRPEILAADIDRPGGWIEFFSLWTLLAGIVGQHETATIVHGACPKGADAIADRFARRHDLDVDPHPADWERYGRSAGYVRNAEMVHTLDRTNRDHLVVAAWNGRSRGTKHTIDTANRLGIRVITLASNG